MGGRPPKQWAFPESLERTNNEEKENEQTMDARHQINEKKNLCQQHKDQEKGYSIPMEGSHGEHWYGETRNRTGSKTPSEPQSTQQRKPTWLVECNCPTRRSWQSDKAVTPVLRRTWLKTNEGQETTHKEIRRETTSDKTVGKKKKIYLVMQQESSDNVPIKVKVPKPNQWNGTNHMWY